MQINKLNMPKNKNKKQPAHLHLLNLKDKKKS